MTEIIHIDRMDLSVIQYHDGKIAAISKSADESRRRIAELGEVLAMTEKTTSEIKNKNASPQPDAIMNILNDRLSESTKYALAVTREIEDEAARGTRYQADIEIERKTQAEYVRA